MSLLKQKITKKKQGDQLLKPKELKVGDNKKYQVEAIINCMVYGQEANNQIPDLYYLILWKSYPEKQNT